MAWNVIDYYQGSPVYDLGNGYVYVGSGGDGQGEAKPMAEYQQLQATAQQQKAAASEQSRTSSGVTAPLYMGGITQGLRGDVGGENATWGINPATGKEEAIFRGPGGMYLLSDLMKQYGSWDAIRSLPSGQAGDNGVDEGMFQTSLWGSRPSDDSFTGKGGWGELATIAAMAAPVAGGALGGAAGTMSGAAGTAEFGGGLASLGADVGSLGAVGADTAVGGAGVDAMTSAGAGGTSAAGAGYGVPSMAETLASAGAPTTGAMLGSGEALAGLGAGSVLGASLGTGLGEAGAINGGSMDMTGSLSSPTNAGLGTVMGTSATGVDMGLGGAGALSGGAMDMTGSAANPSAVANGGTSPSIMQGAGTSGADGLQGLMNQLGLGNVGAGGLGGGSGVGGLTGGGGQQGAYQFPYAQALSGLLGYMGSQQQQNSLQQTMQQAINSDQWRSQQGRYNEPLYQAATQGIGNTAYGQSIADATARKSAAMGYNMSGNQMHDVAQGLNKGSIDYINAVRPMAMGNGGLGSTIAQLGIAGANAQQQGMGALGQTFGNIMQGNQPTLAQQFQGQGTNNSLIDVFKSVSL